MLQERLDKLESRCQLLGIIIFCLALACCGLWISNIRIYHMINDLAQNDIGIIQVVSGWAQLIESVINNLDHLI